MTVDSALNQARPFIQLAGTVLITVAVIKFFGFSVPQIHGDDWQIAIVGFALKHW